MVSYDDIPTEALNAIEKYKSTIVDIKESNGLSYVFITSGNKVYQYFVIKSVPMKILKMMNVLTRLRYIGFHTYNNSVVFKYNILDYISTFISYIPDRIICWKFHICLNSFPTKFLKSFIHDNILKLMWDISKAIYGLNLCNIIHGDCRIDNIGIKDGRFILFDFDGSRYIDDNEDKDCLIKDIYDFVTSIKFHLCIRDNDIIPDVDNVYNFMHNIIINSRPFAQKNKIENYLTLNGINNIKYTHTKFKDIKCSDKETVFYLENLRLIY